MKDGIELAPGQPDPTKLINQPALQQSQGAIWMVMGGLFLLASLISFGAMVVGGSGESTTLAVTFASIVVMLYAALVVVRFAVNQQKLRLRIMAVCMLTMAFISLVGIWLCALIESAVIR